MVSTTAFAWLPSQLSLPSSKSGPKASAVLLENQEQRRTVSGVHQSRLCTNSAPPQCCSPAPATPLSSLAENHTNQTEDASHFPRWAYRRPLTRGTRPKAPSGCRRPRPESEPAAASAALPQCGGSVFIGRRSISSHISLFQSKPGPECVLPYWQ